MKRMSLILAGAAWLVLLIALLARDFRTPLSTYSSLRYGLILGCLLAIPIFFAVVYRFWAGLNRKLNLWTAVLALGGVICLPLAYALHRSFGAEDWFPFSVALWALLLIVAALLVLPDRRIILGRLAGIAFGIFFALGLLEGGLRLLYVDDTYQVIEGDLRLEFAPQTGVLPGVEGVSHYTTDPRGIRAALPYDDLDPQTYRVLAIGGSTTENLYLDDGEAWHSLLDDLAQADGRDIWIGSVGKAGHRAANHFYVLRDFVPQFKIDMVLMMVGANDLALTLRNSDQNRLSIAYVLDHEEAGQAVLNQFFRVPYKLSNHRTGIVTWDYFQRQIAPHLWAAADNILVEDAAGQNYVERRRLWRASPPTLDALPANFADALAVYRENLEMMIAEARRQGVELVFINQPAVWSEDMPAEFEQYLWFIQIGDLEKSQARYTVPVMAEGLAQFNAMMAEVCAAEGLTCVDIADNMNGDTTLFFDDVHFNEKGSRRVAELIWQTLKDKLP